jgi:Domain of unknown function (DUF6430)
MNILEKIAVGLRRHPKRPLTSAFIAYSVMWTALEPSSFLFPTLKPEGGKPFAAMLSFAVAFGVFRSFPKQATKLRIKSINTTIEVSFGDLFHSQSSKIISVNEFFDSELGDHVSERSVHGQFIRRYFSGHPASFNELVDAELRGMPNDEVSRTTGRTKRYPIGTTAVIRVGSEQFFLTAVTHTDLVTLKSACDTPTLWRALSGLWSAIRNRAGGAPVAMPLIGGGLAGIGLAPQALLHLIVMSIVDASRERHIASPIHIVLPYSLFDEIDLESLENLWS